MHPNFDAAATGAASYSDFLIFVETARRLEGGVFANIGTAVMGPEIFLKAVTMARNVAHQRGECIRAFHHGGVRFGRAWRRSRPRAREIGAAILLSSLQERAGADGGRRRRKLLRAGRPPPDHPALYDQIVMRAKT